MKGAAKFALTLALVAAIASAAPDEAKGTVIDVIAGDVLEVAIDGIDPLTGSGVVTVKVADVTVPPNGSAEGEAARAFAESLLENRTVFLDIDNESEDGRDSLGRLLAVVYLVDPDGEVNLTHPLSRILVDAGIAEVKDVEGDEFDPGDWWRREGEPKTFGGAQVVINEVEANPPEGDKDREWAELYNDGFGDVDIGNWTVTTTGGSIVVIPPGKILPGGGFLLVRADGYWLRNEGEIVILRDDAGRVVDETPSFDDEDDDGNSWSRSPDGGEEWVFIEASPEGPVPPAEPTAVKGSDEDDDNWLLGTGGCDPYGLWDVSEFLQ